MSARSPWVVELEIPTRVRVEVSAVTESEAIEEAIEKHQNFRRVLSVHWCSASELPAESESDART